jgi:hypothetical protein
MLCHRCTGKPPVAALLEPTEGGKKIEVNKE